MAGRGSPARNPQEKGCKSISHTSAFFEQERPGCPQHKGGQTLSYKSRNLPTPTPTHPSTRVSGRHTSYVLQHPRGNHFGLAFQPLPPPLKASNRPRSLKSVPSARRLFLVSSAHTSGRRATRTPGVDVGQLWPSTPPQDSPTVTVIEAETSNRETNQHGLMSGSLQPRANDSRVHRHLAYTRADGRHSDERQIQKSAFISHAGLLLLLLLLLLPPPLPSAVSASISGWTMLSRRSFAAWSCSDPFCSAIARTSS